MPPKTLPDFTDVTTGYYMISGTRGLVDAVCFLALGGVFAETMSEKLLLMTLSIASGGALGKTARYIPAIMAFILSALVRARLPRAPQAAGAKDRRCHRMVRAPASPSRTSGAGISCGEDARPSEI